jgi:hypothetical protein
MESENKTKIPANLKIIERFDYLIIESEFELAQKDFTPVIDSIKKFNDKYKESFYQHRVQYLLAKSYIRMYEKDKGIELLNNLVNGKEVPSYLKEGAKTELNLLKLKQEAI